MTRLLVVDDSKVIRNAARKMLGAEFDVVIAEDGSEAWSILENDPAIQVVFTDLVMPGLNGYELLRDIRTAVDPRLRALPVIVVTGVDEDEVARVRALELGATDFVTKPFTSIDLLARARAHASHQRETTQLRAQTTLDQLTGLPNKAGFLDRLQQDMAYARRHAQELTLVRIEVEDLRSIFLRRGKETAERLLLNVAKSLRAAIRKEDTAGRIALGGFALSLPAGERQGVERMVARLRTDLAEQSASVGAGPVRFGTGVSRPPLETGLSAQEVLDQCQPTLADTSPSAVVPAAPVPAPVTAPAPPAAPLVAPTGVAAVIAPPGVTPAVVPSPAAPVIAPPAVTPAAAPSAVAPGPLLIDPLLAQIERGNPQPAIAGMPLILRRLLPLLRLLTPAQRDGLIRFLQSDRSNPADSRRAS